MNLWAIFLTGLTTGGLSCLAVQGGLLTSVIANQKEDEIEVLEGDAHSRKAARREAYLQKLRSTEARMNPLASVQRVLAGFDWLPITMFLVAKLLSHVALGALLGALGSVITLSLGVRLTFQVFTALFMFATAMNLLEVHPIFRYVMFQPPRFLQRFIRNTARGKAMFTPAILGLLTVFIPCGVTQAMEVIAINTGNPVYGALIMGAFVLGTSPLFTLIGIATAKFSDLWNHRFLQVAAVALMFMTLYSLNGVFVVLNLPFSAQNIVRTIADFGKPPDWYGSAGALAAGNSVVPTTNGKQAVTITIDNNGYTPKEFTVRAGVPVELDLETNKVYTCASSFTFRKFKIFEQLKPTDSKILAFTPTEKGSFQFSCSMGMYTGVMHVI
ncbi:MAG: hypothetical protein A2804_03565 [Candidatus Pacebacteria bacterium RIFCSPHIGHO2_01_FULL_46_10]|nr:MAG: hypothetical protein A2804_03565 [Candidatus Pacebacteria bacterium RIFCSPHIGHO2_01_FULL_46_10]